MINQLTTMDFYSARNIVTSELEQNKSIGKLILRDYPEFDRVIRVMAREIEIALNELEEENTLMSKDMFNNLKYVIYNLPIWVLRYPEYSWNKFISAFILLYENYLDIQIQILQILKDRKLENFDENWGLVEHDIHLLKDEVYPALQNLSIYGVTLKDLVLIAKDTIQELQELRHARPVSMQLSETYLQSLGIE